MIMMWFNIIGIGLSIGMLYLAYRILRWLINAPRDGFIRIQGTVYLRQKGGKLKRVYMNGYFNGEMKDG